MFVRLRRTRTLAEATLIRTTLEAAGVPARLRGELRPGVLGEIPLPDAMVEVLVDESVVLAAEAALLALERAARRGVWFCRACGEENPGGFELCWKCGVDPLA